MSTYLYLSMVCSEICLCEYLSVLIQGVRRFVYVSTYLYLSMVCSEISLCEYLSVLIHGVFGDFSM